eukprot:TRINITY_DN3667_c0_g1_i1.p1 TRINITY_DN3667_c0_g1~~TRINITY_DN3667_c0_g1_i1.p1  ORF type:complete len:358 (+),score=161.93 TRINITY_DN3667_c0_g1_i1:100-1173(+)
MSDRMSHSLSNRSQQSNRSAATNPHLNQAHLGKRHRSLSSNSTEVMSTSKRSQNVKLEPLDEALVRLLMARNQKTQKQVHLPVETIQLIMEKSREIFLAQPTLLDLMPPINVVGDIHGHFGDLLTIFEQGGFPPNANYLFLGDYVDRGRFSIETLCLCLIFKIKFPNNFFMLRGNHECAMINRVYGFYDDCKRRYNLKVWKGFTDIFNCLPMAALIDDRIFCVHAGLSPNLATVEQVEAEIQRPKEVLDHGMACDLLWADPEEGIKGFGVSERGVSFTYGADMIEKFLKKNNLDLICRAHQVVEDGYQFFAQRTLVTIFSASNYCGEFDNAGAFMQVEADLSCSFKVLLPITKKKRG